MFELLPSSIRPPLSDCYAYFLCLVPHCDVAQELLRPGGETQLEGEAEHSVDMPQEIQSSGDLCFDLKHNPHFQGGRKLT